jgi:TolB-like protein/Flp pilus assembly protein TadD
MGEPLRGTPLPEKPVEVRLESWKEIAVYVGRDVTTAQRWEKREGMPVHRHLHDKRGSVYALSSELDAWQKSRSQRLQETGELEEGASKTPVVASIAAEADIRRGGVRARWWIAVVGLAAIAVLSVGYVAYRSRAQHSTRGRIGSVAVLPLKNLSGDPSQDYFADGMTDALIGRLAGIRELRVISYTSVMRFKNPQESVPEIARTLNVDAIVEGSLMRDGNRIRVTAQLIRGATDEHFWSETYDRDLQDVLTLQSELAESIAAKVQVTLTGEEHQRLAATRSVAPEVYESYLQGSYELNKTPTKANIEQGITDFNDAIKRDPTFAPAYVGLAEGYNELGSNFIGEPPDAMRQKAIGAARKALELDPTLAYAHAQLAAMLTEQWQWAEGEAEYKRALELNPNDAVAYEGYAWWLLYQGRADEGVEWGRRGRALDPFTVEGPDFADMLCTARRYDEAIHELRTLLGAQPDDPVALWGLGIVLTEDKQPKEAIPLLEKAVALSNRSAGVIGNLARAYALAGRRSDAKRLLSELQQRRKAGFVPARAFIDVYIGLGDNDQAFAWLEQGYKDRSNIMQRLKASPDFDPLRGDPRFAELVRRVGLG